MAEKQRRIDLATALHDKARTLYQEGGYRAAIRKLEAAVEIDPDGKELIYNLAVIHERLGEIDVAERYYRDYLAMEAQPKEREQVEAVLKRLQGAKRELLNFRAPRFQPPPLAASPQAQPAPPLQSGGGVRPIEPWVFVSGSIAAGALVISNVFAVLALTHGPGFDERPGSSVTITDLRADANAAHRYAVIADVAMLVAGLSGAAAVYLYLTTPPRAPSATVTPSRRSRFESAPSIGAGALLPDPARSRQGEPLVGVSLGAGGARLTVQF